jgi:hypothetical protein
MPDDGSPKDPRFLAAVDMLGRTGAESFQIRYSDDEQPVVWVAVVGYERPGGMHWECAGAMSPLGAILRLCETMIDGGQCTHCKRPSGFSEDIDTMPMDHLVCWFQYDPELKTFRRGCEGE